ncbi:unnamed protein product [Rotaria sp. Silwood1]|nr:unnamed protein product [Rotaria sp. Silwood1]
MTVSTTTKSATEKSVDHSIRKWFGVIWLLIEVNLIGGTIFGFPALFQILPQYGIYGSENDCSSSIINTTESDDGELSCQGYQTRHYQNALTLGIILFEIPSVIIGPMIDRFGCRFVKLIGIIFHIIGWLALALITSGRDSLLYVHTSFSSLASISVLLTAYTSSGYFSKSRAFVSALFAGACTSATMWYSIFQILIDAQKITLQQLSYIWMSFGVLMLVSSFVFLDWSFPLLNLPYQFNTTLEKKNISQDILTDHLSNHNEINQMNWYERILKRKGVWHHLISPLYLLVVLFLRLLLLPGIFLSVIWYPWVYYITKQDTILSKKQKLFNISLMQTISWLLNIIACIICMFVRKSMIIPALVINCIARATISGGSQAVVATFFPTEYIGTLTGVMWTSVGVIATVQYGLVQLTNDITGSWRGQLVVFKQKNKF